VILHVVLLSHNILLGVTTLVNHECNLPFSMLNIIIDLLLLTKVQLFQLLFNINRHAHNHKSGTDG